MAKKNKTQYPPQHTRLPPIQHTGPAPPHWVGNNNHMNASQPVTSGHHYNKSCDGPSVSGPNRYHPPSGNPHGAGYKNNPNHSSQARGGYTSGTYQGRGPYAGNAVASGPPARDHPGHPNYQQSNQFEPSNPGRGSNTSGTSRNQQYGWQH